jgi:hypothetical protein
MQYTPEYSPSQERLKWYCLRGKMALVQMVTNLFKILQSGSRFDNWLLLLRTVEAAILVQRHLTVRRLTPDLGSAIRAVEHLYLPPQRGWSINEKRMIASAAHLIIRIPISWGRCVQQSLITYRLLNGYGIPCRICFGVSLASPEEEGHAWIRTVAPLDQYLAGEPEPLDRFRIVYISALPQERN